MNFTISEKLCYSTVRIECGDSFGNIFTGTGFFLHFLEDTKTNSAVPVIITNKHVVRDASIGKFVFTLRDENGLPIDKRHYSVTIDDFKTAWRFHPDESVDLCYIPLKSIIEKLEEGNIHIFYIPFSMKLIPNKEQLADLRAIEEIVMIGYPNGIWDEVNNQPILRRGITATHPNKDYQGKKEFMIDAACFPGSSGSPVLLYSEGAYTDKRGNFYAGAPRLLFLGVMYAGPQFVATGEVQIVNIPTRQIPVAYSNIPNNLGLVIKSERIRELEEMVKREIEENTSLE